MRLVWAWMLAGVAFAASTASAQPAAAPGGAPTGAAQPRAEGPARLATPPVGVADREPGPRSTMRRAEAAGPPRVSGRVDVCWDPVDFPPGRTPDGEELSAHRCRRDTVEIVELYVWGVLFGLGTGGWVDDRLQLDDPGLQLGVALVTGGGAALGVYELDSIDGGLAPGVPTSIASGLLLGLFEGVLAWGAFGNDPFTGHGVGTFYWGATALGGGLGALVGLWRRPTLGDNSLVRSGALWGTFLAQMLKMTGLADDRVDSFRLLFTGYNAGIVGAAILTSVLRPSRLEVLYMDLGGLAGILAGGLVVGASGAGDRVRGAVLGLTTLGGMALSVLLTWPDPPAPLPPGATVEPLAAPVRGGAVVGARSSF